MALRVEYEEGIRTVEYTDGLTAGALLSEMGLHLDAYIVSSGGRVLADDDELQDGMSIKLMKVVSGG